MGVTAQRSAAMMAFMIWTCAAVRSCDDKLAAEGLADCGTGAHWRGCDVGCSLDIRGGLDRRGDVGRARRRRGGRRRHRTSEPNYHGFDTIVGDLQGEIVAVQDPGHDTHSDGPLSVPGHGTAKFDGESGSCKSPVSPSAVRISATVALLALTTTTPGLNVHADRSAG